MPEIAEIARAVHYLRIHLVGKRIASAEAIDDANVFGKVGTTGAAVAAALKGKKVVSAGTQGKYFWITLEKPPHLVMHFGMTGKNDKTAYTNYFKKMEDSEYAVWPPKFWKFSIVTDDEPAVEVAFTDPRRFGRVRLVDCPGEAIRKHSPLVENGPDPVVDKDRFTEDYLRGKMTSRHVPIKALLLDQTMISGIGNWVADETLYHAQMHPEQYCDDFSDAEIKKLYESICYVCDLAVEKLGDSDQFPEHWLFNHRWGKGDKNSPSKLPNGEKLSFITVGGRTSCFAPAIQKKTGRVAASAKTELAVKKESGEEKVPPKKARKSTSKTIVEKADEGKTIPKKDRKPADKAVKLEGKDTTPSKGKRSNATTSDGSKSKKVKIEPVADDGGRRRSGRLRK
ncbi:formamidopyrimidine-DNA glycosylase, putative [Cordyceps militaris CM01]|uniref:Formamidopyrimidine-DNA glycosylase, putative n=1 Tax=Cordyceps militaris (strain CM01) TaxID=983644 RepID=G3JFF3_CORMM|nr:formamidopyrimidine-DNA glycosylase, putative [Cordyceps militaris CM01]EGX93143.1 formamidopyrimidine-DNA glycosylase, putative [Cordyceps militaris CM01]